MHSVSKILSTSVLAMAFFGCGNSTQNGSQLLASRTSTHHLLVLSGGYGSCGQPSFSGADWSYPQVASLQKSLTRSEGSTVDTIYSCFGTEPFDLEVNVNQSGQWQGLASFGAYFQILQDRINRDTGLQVHLIGHSHGGWLGMETVSALKIRPAQLTLETLDPISYSECQAGDVAGSILGSIFGADGAPGCTQAPVESTAFVTAIKDKAVRWQNLFQDQYRLIHSSAAPMATNWHVPFGYGPMRKFSHTEMASDERVWALIHKHLASDQL